MLKFNYLIEVYRLGILTNHRTYAKNPLKKVNHCF